MKLEPKNTAMLTLDFQNGILQSHPATSAVIPRAEKAVAFARSRGLLLIHVGLGFSEGHPEIPADRETPFLRAKKANLFVKGSPSAEFHPALRRAEDHVIYKHRVSAFSENQLELVLRAHQVNHLILFGVATSGIVLSTVRRAMDLDYACTILEDACFDPDPEVHRVLTEKVFARHANVTTVEKLLSAQET